MARGYQEQSVHDSLVRMMVSYFSTLGYLNIRADLENFSRPDKIWWQARANQPFIPDLTCQMNNLQRTQIVMEAETCDSLSLDHTRQQFALFSAHAIQYKKEFHVAVPRLCNWGGRNVTGEQVVKHFANEWKVTVHGIWWPSS